ncbi:MAG: methyltransferase domain-containing protein [bacterium]|nr:methyltransferase domain-containing protein [bacterium]
MSDTHHTQRIEQYYRDMRSLIDIVTAQNGYANLGWLPEHSSGDYQTAQRLLVRTIADQLQLRPQFRVLEIGCGLGGPARQIATEFSCEVYGLELLRSQIDAGQKTLTAKDTIHLIQASAQALPFPRETFEAVYSLESAFHYPDKSKFVSEVAAVLKPGGRFAIADVLFTGNRRNGWRERQVLRALGAHSLYTEAKYREAAQQNGLRFVSRTDLTSGVCRSVQKMAPLIFQHWHTLRDAHYANWYLLAIAAIAKLSPITYPIVPVRYTLLGFEKSLR